jgi:hypothetical protein
LVQRRESLSVWSGGADAMLQLGDEWQGDS